MNLKAKINGIEYNVLQGATFAEEFNETLDSGSIIISEVNKLNGLKPYDDVFVYTGEFNGYPFSDINIRPKFYKHLLVDQFTEEVLVLGDTEEETIYKYKIELMSETKKLEKIILPNISVTQPITGEKTTAWEHLNRFVDMYSPVYKKVQNESLKTWDYAKKYTIDSNLRSKFENIYTPEFTLNAPTLKDLLAKIFITRDIIPYVKDDVIYGLDISTATGEFQYDPQYCNQITGSMSSDNYTDGLRRNYSSALSSENTCRSIETVGFRNSSNPLMTLQNMRVELGKPIYNINRFLMCYYKKADAIYSYVNLRTVGEDGFLVWGYDERKTYKKGDYCFGTVTKTKSNVTVTGVARFEYINDNPAANIPLTNSAYWQDKTELDTTHGEIREIIYFVCRQDITKLVVLNKKRNLLKQDWEDLTNNLSVKSIDDMSKYKFFTVGYDIGSTTVSGWGETLTYPTFWNDYKYNYIHNILSKMDTFYPWGVDSSVSIGNNIAEGALIKPYYRTSEIKSLTEMMEGLFTTVTSAVSYLVLNENIANPFTNTSLKVKGLWFNVDYEGFYNGALLHSKDNDRDDITTADNASESLTLLEQDGIYEKEKVNRYGNKSIQINARYDDYTEDNYDHLLQPIGSVWSGVYEKDIIIFHREYSIYDNMISCIYYGTKDYLLKNYFTTVYAKHRAWNIMSYDESTLRAENVKNYILLSKNRQYYESSNWLAAQGLEDKFLSCFKSSPKISEYYFFNGKDGVDWKDKINQAYIKYDEFKYLCDLLIFVNKNSLCFNLKMFDNFSQGVYIQTPEPFIGKHAPDESRSVIEEGSWKNLFVDWFYDKDDYSGSRQDWWQVTDKNGESKLMGFYFSHKQESKNDKMLFDFESVKIKYGQIFNTPRLEADIEETNIIGKNKHIYKDSKEVLDYTYQFENIADDGILFSPWLLKLSDLYGEKIKTDEPLTYGSTQPFDIQVLGFLANNTAKNLGTGTYESSPFLADGSRMSLYPTVPMIIVKLPQDTIKDGAWHNVGNEYTINFSSVNTTAYGMYVKRFVVKKIKRIQGLFEDKVYLNGEITYSAKIYGKPNTSNITVDNYTIVLQDFTSLSAKEHGIARLFPEAESGYVEFRNVQLVSMNYFPFFRTLYIGMYNDSMSEERGWIKFTGANGEQYGFQTGVIQENTFSYELIGLAEPIDTAYAVDSYGEALPRYDNNLYQNNEKFVDPTATHFKTVLGYQQWATETDNSYEKGYRDITNLKGYYRRKSWAQQNFENVETRERDLTEINVSSATVGDFTVGYRKNMFIGFSEDIISENTVTFDYIASEFFSSTMLSKLGIQPQAKISTYVSYWNNKIRITLPQNGLQNINSVQYWYLDDFPNAYSYTNDRSGNTLNFKYDNSSSYAHFVFGINLTDEDKRRGYVDIYLSAITHKDQRVFDSLHNEIGSSLNYIGSDKDYGVEQYYELKDNEK